MTYLEEFKKEMMRARSEIKLSKSDLARKISKSPSFICDIECGRKKPSLETAFDISKELGISLDEILNNTLIE